MKLPLWQIITGLGITQIIGWGTTYYAIGALSQSIEAETGWSKSLVFGAFSAALLLSATVSKLAGRTIDKHGAKHIMLLGSIMAAAGSLLFSVATIPTLYVIAWLILGVAMRLCTYDAAFTALSQVAGNRTRLSISYLSLFGGLASTAFWPLGHYLSSHYGWQNTFLIYAALHLFICAPLHYFLLSGRSVPTVHEAEVSETDVSGPDRTIPMFVFAGVLATNGFVFAAISAHVLKLFEDINLTPAHAVLLASFIGPAQVLSRIAEIVFGRHWKPSQLGLLAYGLLPVALATLIIGQFSLAAAVVFVLLYGMSNGLTTIAKGAYPLALFGRKNYGETIGTLTIPSLVLNSLAPLIMAYTLSAWGAHASFILCCAVGSLSLLGMIFLAKRYKA